MEDLNAEDTCDGQSLHFGNKLQIARKRLRMSQRMISEGTGLSQSAISEMVRIKRRPYLDQGLRIARCLGVTLESLADDQMDLVFVDGSTAPILQSSASAVQPQAEQWAYCELMGHQKMAGRISEEHRFGGTVNRLDVPQLDGAFATTYFTAQAIFRVTFVTEDVARQMAKGCRGVAATPFRPLAIESFANDGYGEDDD